MLLERPEPQDHFPAWVTKVGSGSLDLKVVTGVSTRAANDLEPSSLETAR